MRGTWKKLASRRGALASASSTGSDGATWSGAQRAVERHRVRHRLDARGVELPHGVDVVEDGVEIARHARDLLVGEREARQDRQLTHFFWQ